MKKAVVALVLLFFCAGAAYAFDVINYNGVYFYRPADVGGTKPGPGLPPLPVEVGFDFDLAPTGAKDAVAWALDVWNAVPNSTFEFQNIGDSQCVPMFDCADGIDQMVWVKTGWPFGADAIAITTFTDVNSATGIMRETDIYFNGQYYRFSISDTPVAGLYDLKSVAVHELGHTAALDDLYDYHFEQSTMYGYGEPSDLKARTLDADDEDGITFLYPLDRASYPNPGLLGLMTMFDTNYVNRTAMYSGDVYNQTLVKGYGFVYTQPVPSATIEAEVWQSGAKVASPAAALFSFIDMDHIKVDFDLTASPPVGEYDLLVRNPNGKTTMLPGAIQVNSGTNVQPEVTTDGVTGSYFGTQFTTCANGTDPTGDGDGDAALVYRWSLIVQPDAASTTLVNSDQRCVSFNPSALGWYALDVEVYDGIVWSASDGIEVLIAMMPSLGGGGHHKGGCAFNDGGADVSGIVFPGMILPAVFLFWLKRRNSVTR